MTPKELAEYAKVCRKHGIASLEIGGTKLTLQLDHTTSKTHSYSEPTTEQMSDEDILFYSSTVAESKA